MNFPARATALTSRLVQERLGFKHALQAAEVPLPIGWRPGPVAVIGATVGLGQRILLERVVNQVVEDAACRFRTLLTEQLVGSILRRPPGRCALRG